MLLVGCRKRFTSLQQMALSQSFVVALYFTLPWNLTLTWLDATKTGTMLFSSVQYLLHQSIMQNEGKVIPKGSSQGKASRLPRRISVQGLYTPQSVWMTCKTTSARIKRSTNLPTESFIHHSFGWRCFQPKQYKMQELQVACRHLGGCLWNRVLLILSNRLHGPCSSRGETHKTSRIVYPTRSLEYSAATLRQGSDFQDSPPEQLIAASMSIIWLCRGLPDWETERETAWTHCDSCGAD